MTQCVGMPKSIAVEAVKKTPIDIEDLVQWAVMHSKPVLRIPSERSLMFNYGYDAIPKGCGTAFAGGDSRVPVRRSIDLDADRVLQAINALDPWSRSLVTANAKAQRRPDWMQGVKPQLEDAPPPRRNRGRSKSWRKKQIANSRAMTWKNGISPYTVRQAQATYTQWHASLRRLADVLKSIETYEICGFAAPAEPWNIASKQDA